MNPLRTTLAALTALCLGAPASAEALVCRAVIEHTAPPINACIGKDTVRIAAVGDVLLHRPLQARGYNSDKGFHGIWRAAEPLFRAADIAYANLEGPVAPGITRAFNRVRDPGPVFDNRVYSSYPMFNYHPRVIADLKAAGVTLVSTANNHALDRGSAGADLTIRALRQAGLPYTGTIPAGAPRVFVTYTPTKLGRIAWIACSYSTNGIADRRRQVLMCYDDRAELLALVGREAQRAEVAAVIVTPHWGYEYQHSPNRNQRALARQLVAAGASAVIGTHPHVVQPWEYLKDPSGRNALVVYSTGNFVSGQVTLARRTGVMAWVELCRAAPPRNLETATRSRLAVSRAGWLPLVMARTAAGPELTLAWGSSKGALAQARALVAKHLPKGQLTPRLACRKPDEKLVALQ